MQPPARILVAEDDTEMRNILKKSLTHEGFLAHTVADGCLALDRIQAGDACDLLITDIQMPGTDGEALLEKALEIRPDLKVILITGYGSVEQHAAMMRKGAVGYVTKPFKIPDLLDVIEDALAPVN